MNIIPPALWAQGGLRVALFPLPSSIQLSQPFQSLKEWVYPSFNSFPWSLDASPEGGRLSCFRLPTDFFPIHFWTLFRTPFQWPPKPSEDGLESVLDGPCKKISGFGGPKLDPKMDRKKIGRKSKTGQPAILKGGVQRPREGIKGWVNPFL